MLLFLEMIHISLKEAWFICRGHKCRCELFISQKIFTLGSVSINAYVYMFLLVLGLGLGLRLLSPLPPPVAVSGRHSLSMTRGGKHLQREWLRGGQQLWELEWQWGEWPPKGLVSVAFRLFCVVERCRYGVENK